MDSDPDRLKRLGQGATGGQNGSDSQQNSAVKGLDNLDINLQEIN